MKTKKCGELGTIEYRLPNIPEAMILLAEMGLTSKKLKDKKAMVENEFIYAAKLIKSLEQFVSKINLKINNKEITKYEDVLNEFSMMTHLNDIAAEVFNALNGDNKKKS